jgi:predicted nuclease of predicted toxin-antitoxin system
MSKLFAELYLDENIPVLVGKILRARGVSVKTTDEAGNKGKSDPDQLQFAVGMGLAIVTMNRVDFEKLAKEYFYSGKDHFGIFIIADNAPQVIAQRLNDVVDLHTADEMKNQIIYL